jgi:hypothetical protein
MGMNDELTGISLCAGVGGLDLGVEIAFPEVPCENRCAGGHHVANVWLRPGDHAGDGVTD